jgi:hypothetical protein
MGGLVLRAGGASVVLAALVLGLFAPPGKGRADHGHLIVPGFDISWPQCGKLYPPGPVAFGIIGINGGKPYTSNPCFMDEYRWAQHMEANPAVYVNTDYPRPGRAEAMTGPAGACAEDDEPCRAYNYGYGIGREVTQRAGRLRVTPSFWWLDVETANYWTDNTEHNAQVIRGAADFFRERKLPVGVYGTPYQWRLIAGSLQLRLPVWSAGAENVDDAASRCGDPRYAFNGGAVTMVQYYNDLFDLDYDCTREFELARFPMADPFGRTGPPGRSLTPSGAILPRWIVVPGISR